MINLRPIHLVFLALIVVIAAVLRFHNLTALPLSIDELGSMEVAAGRGQLHLTLPRDKLISPAPAVTTLNHAPPIWDVPLHMETDVHPPLYFLTLRLWQDAFGGSDFSSRTLSVIASLFAVVVIFDLGRWLAGPECGLCAALLMALAQPQIAGAQDARPYALLTLLVLCAADALLRIERLAANRRRTIALGLATLAGLLTHYFILPAVVSLAIYAAIRLRGAARRQACGAIITAVCAAASLWGYGLWSQSEHFGSSWMYWFNERVPNHVVASLARAAALPIRYLADPPTGSAVASLAAVLYVLPWLMLRKRPALLLPALLLVSTPALMLALDLDRGTTQIEWIKYSLVAGIGVYLTLPLILPKPTAQLAITAAAAIYATLALFAAPQNKTGQIQFAADLQAFAKPDEPVVFAAGGWGDWYTGTLYMYLERYAPRLPDCVALLNAPTPELLQELRRHPRVWLITSWTSRPPNVFLPGCSAILRRRYPYAAMLYEITWQGASKNP